MCGFIGFISDINDKQNDIISKKFEFYYKELKKRGPDYSEIKKIKFKSKIIQLGFVRLSIQDTRQNSNKIFHDENNIILFNGEIYNFKELKKKYLSNAKFETNTDTEVLFRLYKLKGKNILIELRGIFSFVFIDLKNENIQLVRDFTGTKPLYYLNKKQNIFFSSEAWFLYSVSEKKIDESCLNFYFNFGFTKEDRTLIQDVKKIPSNHLYKFSLNNFELNKEKYFNLDSQKNFNNPSTEETRECVENSIKRNLISDTKIGTFLSGGVDSSTITILAKKFNQNIESFTTVFLPEQKFKKFNVDLNFSKKISHDYGIKLNTCFIEDNNQFFKDFLKVTKYLDEPVSNLNFLNTYWQTKQANEKNIKVILTGDGADEMFCGYDRYVSAYFASKFKFLKYFNKKINLINNLKKNEIPYHYYSILKDKSYQNSFRDNLIKKDILNNNFFDEFNSESKIDLINYFDTRYWLTNENNYKLDKCSMINSVEARVPFQDFDILNKFFFISNQRKFNYLNRKSYLKNIGILPKYVIQRKKMGWFTPDRIFLDNHLNKILVNFFTCEKINHQNIFNYSNLIKYFETYSIHTYKMKKQILTIVLFQLWYDNVLNLY